MVDLQLLKKNYKVVLRNGDVYIVDEIVKRSPRQFAYPIMLDFKNGPKGRLYTTKGKFYYDAASDKDIVDVIKVKTIVAPSSFGEF